MIEWTHRSTPSLLTGAEAPDSHPAVEPLDLLDPLAQAITIMESGLIEDRRTISRSELRGLRPDWSQTVVIGELPARYRGSYDARFANRIVRAGFALSRDWARGEAAPQCPAEFLLARWLINHASRIAEIDSSRGPARPREWAYELGLIAGPSSALVPAGIHDPWIKTWDLESVRLDPADWFKPAFARTRSDNTPPPRRARKDWGQCTQP